MLRGFRVPIRVKIFVLVMGFLAILSAGFLTLSYDFFINDKINSVQEIQALQLNKASNEMNTKLDFFKVKLRESAIRLVDRSRGGVEQVAEGFAWVRIQNKEWRSDEFRGKAIPLLRERKEKLSLFEQEDRVYFLIQESMQLSLGGEIQNRTAYGLLPLDIVVSDSELKQGIAHLAFLDMSKLEDVDESRDSIVKGSERLTRLFGWLVRTQRQSWLRQFSQGGQAMGSIVKDAEDNPSLIMGWAPVFAETTKPKFVLISLVEFRTVRAAFRDFVTQLIVGGILILGLSVFAAVALARHISKPVEKVVEATKVLQTGDFDVKVDVKQVDEIGDLGRAFNLMGDALKDREEQLKNAQGALVQSEKLAALGTLSAGIAHEVKNPLAGILGNVELAQNRVKAMPGENQEKLAKYLEVIAKETKRTRGIIDGLMRFSRKEEQEHVPFDLEVVLNETVNLVEHSLNMANVTLHTHYDPNLWMVNGHANSVEQIFLNMIQNAQHAMPDGGRIDVYTDYVNAPEDADVGAFIATLHPEFQGPFCRVRIQDTGSGMTREVMQKIFEPFFTTKPSGVGTGLGLSVTMNILSEHKTRVSIDSTPGEGTTFLIDFMAVQQRDSGVLAALQEVENRKGSSPEELAAQHTQSNLIELDQIPKKAESSDGEVEEGLTLGAEIESGALKPSAEAPGKVLSESLAKKSKEKQTEGKKKVAVAGFNLRRPKS